MRNEKRIKKIFSEKYLPTFQKLALFVFKKIYKKEETFWNWNYFEQDFFREIIENGNSGEKVWYFRVIYV